MNETETNLIIYLKARLIESNLPADSGIMVSVDRAGHMFIASHSHHVANAQTAKEALSKLVKEIGTQEEQSQRLRAKAAILIAEADKLEATT